jgi:hypothetical protein
VKLPRLRRREKHRKAQRDRQGKLWRKTHKRGHARAATRDAKAVRYLRSLIRRLTKRRRAAHREGADWAYGEISPKALKAAGKSFVCRYLSYTPSKNLDAAEAKRYGEAGIDCVVVWETTGTRATAGYEAGIVDAKRALSLARKCGKPNSAPIFFAVDFEASGPEVRAYFEGTRSVLGVERNGAYAGRGAMTYLFDEKIIGHGWQTYAWSNGEWDKRAHLRQVQNGVTLAGVEVDLDVSTAASFGQWRSTLA